MQYLSTRVATILVSATSRHSCNYCVSQYIQQLHCSTCSVDEVIPSHAFCIYADCCCFRCSNLATTGAREEDQLPSSTIVLLCQ
eukprot:2599-Heterococcus_DN1.PRE.1